MKSWTTAIALIVVAVILWGYILSSGILVREPAEIVVEPFPKTTEVEQPKEDAEIATTTQDTPNEAAEEPRLEITITPVEKDNDKEEQIFTHYYEYDRESLEIEIEQIPLECLDLPDGAATKPFFINNDECTYCESGTITDESRDECFDMLTICQEIKGEEADSPSDGKCGCQVGYRLSSGKCVLIEEA